MSLNRALVDTARRYGKARTGRKVEGTTVFVDTGAGPEFRCRLMPQNSPKNTGASGSPVDSVGMNAQVMCGIRDSEGNTLVFSAGDQIEVISKELGTSVWIVWADPDPIRKRKTLIGWTLTVQRFDQPDLPPQRRVERVRSMTDRMATGDVTVSRERTHA